MTDLRKLLASNMKVYRKTLGLTQDKLAEMLNISYNYIALIETGRRFPSIKMLERIAKALKKDTIELFSIKHIESLEKNALKKAILMDIEQALTVRFNESEL